MKILITGGAGFVGSQMAIRFKEQNPKAEIVCFDNLRRRGSEINLSLFKERGIEFVHGDIRVKEDLESLQQDFDLFLEASAEPSVLAGLNGSPAYVLQTNLTGTLNCLEFARQHTKKFIFLSTSRVYSIDPLKEIPLLEEQDRFEVDEAKSKSLRGISLKGISESFRTDLPRSLYGATKLASELIVQEYTSTYGLKSVINRCGVIAGPGQFGKVDQGVFTLWVARHYFKGRLKYTGFGGEGKQVRDLLHPEDLYQLLNLQFNDKNSWNANVYNVGGGKGVSTSLKELTAICEKVTGSKIEIERDLSTSSVDIPYYISDCSLVEKALSWRPKKTVTNIVEDIAKWMEKNEEKLKPLFA